MVKNKLTALAICLGLFACQNMHAEGDAAVTSVTGVVAAFKASGDFFVKEHLWKTVGAVATLGGAALYNWNLTVKNKVRELLGLDPIVRKKCCCSCSSCSKCCHKSMPTSERCPRVCPSKP